MGAEGREGSRFVPGAVPTTGEGWGTARERPGGAGGSWRLRHPLSASSFPPALHLARLSLARLLCARRAHCTQGALWSPGPSGSDSPFPPTLLRGERSSGVRPGCVFVNCVSGIGSGVPHWLAVGFSPCSTQPLPSVTCRRFFPGGAGSPRFVRQQ